MTTAPLPSAPQRRHERRRCSVAVTIAVCLVLVIAVVSWAYGPTWIAYSRYEPREGDILFQSLPHAPLVDAIEGATDSPFSHCGVVARQGQDWVVIEAFRRVEVTPLSEFVFRGRHGGFAVYRLRAEYQEHVPEMLRHARAFVGRPYDARYRLDDERIYCSELIYKAYAQASGGAPLGRLTRLGDLNWQPYQRLIESQEGGAIPLERPMITPRDLAQAAELEPIVAHRIGVTATTE